MKTYSITEIGSFDSIKRVTLKEKLGLTGAEVSVNRLPAGTESSFSHAHKRNEEIYIFTSGTGMFWIDGDKIPVQTGSAVRIAPSGVRAIKADSSADLIYICIQADEGSLVQATREDGIRSEQRPDW